MQRENERRVRAGSPAALYRQICSCFTLLLACVRVALHSSPSVLSLTLIDSWSTFEMSLWTRLVDLMRIFTPQCCSCSIQMFRLLVDAFTDLWHTWNTSLSGIQMFCGGHLSSGYPPLKQTRIGQPGLAAGLFKIYLAEKESEWCLYEQCRIKKVSPLNWRS